MVQKMQECNQFMFPAQMFMPVDTKRTEAVAKIWKNGVATTLTDGTKDADIRSVYISGTDIYAAGYERNAGNKRVGKIWKNGVATALTTSTFGNAEIASVFVSGADVYAEGFEPDINTNDIAKVWKMEYL